MTWFGSKHGERNTLPMRVARRVQFLHQRTFTRSRPALILLSGLWSPECLQPPRSSLRLACAFVPAAKSPFTWALLSAVNAVPRFPGSER
jgi:hypothetical protein